jgi:predicted metalloprotease with PDZ domain
MILHMPFARTFLRFSLSATVAALFVASPALASKKKPEAPKAPATPLTIHADLTNSARHILHVHEVVPVEPGEFTLEYPQWIPGDHRPNGPIDNLTGIFIRANGEDLQWRRDPVDLYAFHVRIPDRVTSITVDFDFLSVPGGTGSSTDHATSADLDVLEWSCAVLYPAGVPVHSIPVIPSITLPAGWNFGTALPVAQRNGADTTFAQVSIEELVDSPLIAGRYFKEYTLAPDIKPAHYLDVGADTPEALALTKTQLADMDNLVREAVTLYASQHYDDYHFVLSLSNNIRGEGLEHHQSSDNGLNLDSLSNPKEAAYAYDLMPHEFTHSWNGKYRRPIGLATPDYKVPMQDDLLWVYEGMTQYWGEVLTARSGFWTPAQYLDHLAETAAYYNNRPGRTWRNVEDTAISSSILRGASQNYGNWRLGQDYYSEGELIWMDADVTIRQLTHGQKSLNDFCKIFLGKGGNTTWEVVPYDFDEVVADLNQVVAFDWSGFLRDRLNSHDFHAPLSGIEHGGYKLTYSDKPSAMEMAMASGAHPRIDVAYSLGLRLGGDGTVSDVLIGYPAWKAGFGPGMKIIAINNKPFSPGAMSAALQQAKTDTAPLEFIVTNESEFHVMHINYHDGEKYPHLERVDGTPDVLGDILKPLVPVPAAK